MLIRQKELRRRHKRAQERYKLRMRQESGDRPQTSGKTRK